MVFRHVYNKLTDKESVNWKFQTISDDDKEKIQSMLKADFMSLDELDANNITRSVQRRSKSPEHAVEPIVEANLSEPHINVKFVQLVCLSIRS